MTSKGYDHVSPVSVPSSFRLHYCDRLIQDEDSKLIIIFNRKTIACGYVFLSMSLYTYFSRPCTWNSKVICWTVCWCEYLTTRGKILKIPGIIWKMNMSCWLWDLCCHQIATPFWWRRRFVWFIEESVKFACHVPVEQILTYWGNLQVHKKCMSFSFLH